MSAAARCAGEGAAGTEGAAAVIDNAGAAGGRDEGGVGAGAHADGGAVEALFFERLRLLLHGLTSGGDVDAGGSRRMRRLGEAAGTAEPEEKEEEVEDEEAEEDEGEEEAVDIRDVRSDFCIAIRRSPGRLHLRDQVHQAHDLFRFCTLA